MNKSLINGLAAPGLFRALALTCAVAFLYFNVLSKLGLDWWEDENYSHGLLVPFVIGYILWVNREDLARAPKMPSFLLGAAAILGALVALWAGIAGAELFVQRMSFLLLLAGIVVYFAGLRVLGLMLVPFALLFLAVPIPDIVLNKVTFPLQLFASRCAVWAMRLFEIPVLREGNIIELMPLNSTQTKKLEVVEACSGIRSLMTLVTLAVVFAYFTGPREDQSTQNRGLWSKVTSRNFWRAAIIIVSAVPIAILTNAMRVSATGILARYYGTQIADGFFHSFSGWVMYVAALVLLFAVGWMIDVAIKITHRPFRKAAYASATNGFGTPPETSVSDGHAEPEAPASSSASTKGVK
ncbi:MAG: exosortase [Pyrinomonadaceae bacterium]